jgi:hypothetical protein
LILYKFVWRNGVIDHYFSNSYLVALVLRKFSILKWLGGLLTTIVGGVAIWFVTESMKDLAIPPPDRPVSQDAEWKRTAGKCLNNVPMENPKAINNWDVALNQSGEQCRRAQVALYETRKYAVSEKYRTVKDDYESAMKELCAAHTQLQFHNVNGWIQHMQEAVTHLRAMRGFFADASF